MMIVGDKLQRCQEYVDALRDERRKILMFRRELPLCLDLVTQAIEVCKQQLSETQSDCNSEQTTSDDGPVFQEFMPPSKRNSCSDEHKHEHEHESQESKMGLNNNGMCDEISLKKSDWLESARLSLDPPNKEKVPVPVLGVNRNGGGGAFHPFKRVTSDRTSPTPGTEVGEIRKARRCWSPELHRLFLQALQQLGGSHVATPRQIREMMKIDGLTNDEVKSHLQKYRLHTRRRSSSSSVRNTNYNPQTPQLVVVGGIWAPSPEYASGAAVSDEPSAAGRNEEYGFPCQQSQRQDVKQLRLLRSEGEDLNYPATSSSTDNIRSAR